MEATYKCGCKRQISEMTYKIGGQELIERIEASDCKNCEVKEPEVFVYVQGDTYKHRRQLKSMGLAWDAGHYAWCGKCKPSELPAGCYAVSKSEAAMASMDTEWSAY